MDDATATPIIASLADCGPVIDILTDAFADDPIMRWVSKDPAYATYSFELTVPSCVERQLTFVAADGAGAAVWLPPNVEFAPPVTLAAVAKGILRFGPGAAKRALGLLSQTRGNHPKEPHYYLFAIGARRSARGRGVGATLMHEVLSRCDDEAMPAYLESSNEANLHFYRRHGFEVVQEISLGSDGPKMWFMWRAPRP